MLANHKNKLGCQCTTRKMPWNLFISLLGIWKIGPMRSIERLKSWLHLLSFVCMIKLRSEKWPIMKMWFMSNPVMSKSPFVPSLKLPKKTVNWESIKAINNANF